MVRCLPWNEHGRPQSQEKRAVDGTHLACVKTRGASEIPGCDQGAGVTQLKSNTPENSYTHAPQESAFGDEINHQGPSIR